MIAGAECRRASNVGSAQQTARAGSVQQQGRRGMMARCAGAECRRSGARQVRGTQGVGRGAWAWAWVYGCRLVWV
ncbi:hypothetical protein SLEP1_g51259 [Rubroshorea leprosula]|uniref:Uncharacterized protein n=1 Tax=Rubroshorea leprosula TaxID=152421 RepID=A0AAV5M529_9ROSI|nr:hypothetical protein SLEP1_g51259 [Rubroshorea leprosula]